MKRLGYLAMLMMLASPAQAGESFSFVVAGHRIRIEAPRDCTSPSCVSVSIPGVYERRGWRDDSDDDTATSTEAAPPPAPPSPPLAQQQPSLATTAAALASRLATQPSAQPAIKPAVAAPPPAMARPALAASPDLAPASPPHPAPLAKLQALAVPARIPAEPAQPAARVAREPDSEPGDTPIGDWHSIGKKGAVRIEACGSALCGYALNRYSNRSGEAVLINMKPTTASGEGETVPARETSAKETSPGHAQEWSGSIYSRASGATYNATMALSGPNSLRVEACAVGRYFCTSNIWSRIPPRPDRLMSTR